MPRYFFHSQTLHRVIDEDGEELPDNAAARRSAITACGELMQDAPEGFWSTRPWSVTVTSAAGLVLYEVIMNGFATTEAGAAS